MTRKSELREKIDELQGQVNQLLETNSTLESWRASWLNGYDSADQVTLQTTHDAVTGLYTYLGVTHMTDAVMRIKELLALEQASPTRLELQQQKATAEGAIRIHQLAIKQLEFQRDSAQKREFDTSFERDNCKARCEELEELLRDAIPAVTSDASQETIAALMVRIDAMIGDDK